MSKAWGHKVRALTEQEIEKQTQSGKNWYKFKLEHPRLQGEGEVVPDESKCIHHERKCRISSKCQNECTHMLTYNYVTGRAGRTSWAEKPVCEEHAKKYIVSEGEKNLNISPNHVLSADADSEEKAAAHTEGTLKANGFKLNIH